MTNPTSITCASACIQIHGGFGFTEEYDIDRKFRETWLYSVEAISAPTLSYRSSPSVVGSFHDVLGGGQRKGTFA